MQLLDVGCFQLYKYYYSKAINKIMQIKISEFDNLDFLASFITIHVKTFKKSIIFLVFRKIDLISYNFKIIL